MFDENISTRIVEGMRAFGEEVVHLTDRFEPGTADEDWLKGIGAQGWFLVTRDQMIRKRPAQKAALSRYGIGAFFLGGKDLDRCRQIAQLVRGWPEMKRHASKQKTPFAFRVNQRGTTLKEVELPRP